MNDQSNEQLKLAYLLRSVVLVIIAGIAAFVVWSFHQDSALAFIVALIGGSFFAVITAGLVGVHIVPSLIALTTFGGIFEGIFQGWSRYGLVGAVGGALIGVVASCLIGILPLMLIHAVMILFGFNPFSASDSSDEKSDVSS